MKNFLHSIFQGKNAVFEAKIYEPKPSKKSFFTFLKYGIKARHGHPSALAGGKIDIIGDRESRGSLLSDLWVIDLKRTMKWENLYLKFNLSGISHKNTTLQILNNKLLLLNINDRPLIIYDTSKYGVMRSSYQIEIEKEVQDKIDLPENNTLVSREIHVFPSYKNSLIIGSSLSLYCFCNSKLLYQPD